MCLSVGFVERLRSRSSRASLSCAVVTSSRTHTDAHTSQTDSQSHRRTAIITSGAAAPRAAARPFTGSGSTGCFPPKKGLVGRAVREGCDGKFTFRSRSELAVASASFLFFSSPFSFFNTNFCVFVCAVSSLPSSGHDRGCSHSVRDPASLFFQDF